MILNDELLRLQVGGAASAAIIGSFVWKILAALGIGTFAVGIFDGYTNPIKCRR